MQRIVYLPGLACDEGVWAGSLSRLPGEVSGVHARCDSLDAMAAALLDEHEGALTLIGASMGGMIALHAALRAPERVRALALLGTSARADTEELLRLRREACALFDEGRVDEVLRANVAFAFHPANAARAGLVDEYFRIVQRAGAAQLIRQNRAVMARPDLRSALDRIVCPTLVLVGEADLLTPVEHAQEIAAAIPGAQLEVIPMAGHMLTMEQPEAVLASLERWLAELPA